MSSDDPKAVNLRWITAFNERDWETERAFRSPDYLAHMSGSPEPLDNAGWKAFMESFTTAFPDARITIDQAISDRDLVASRWTITGTHKGEFQGVPPTGAQVTIPGCDMTRIVDGKAAEHWSQFDIVGVMIQIGAMPVPAPA